MQTIKRFFTWFSDKFRKQGKLGKIAIVIGLLISLCCLCTVPIAILTPTSPTTEATTTSEAEKVSTSVVDQNNQPTDTPKSTKTSAPTNTPRPTNTPGPTNTPRPTNTIMPSATPNVNLVEPGTHLIGVDIQPGIYRGMAGSGLLGSCYWQRLKDLSGDLDSILANDNSVGQYYVEILETDMAFETACMMERLPTLPAPPAEFPTTLVPGTYLVGIDIKPGLYKGQAGADFVDSCYWQRLRDVTGSMYSILANDNAIGQYFIQVAATDFALEIACEVTFQK